MEYQFKPLTFFDADIIHLLIISKWSLFFQRKATFHINSKHRPGHITFQVGERECPFLKGAVS